MRRDLAVLPLLLNAAYAWKLLSFPHFLLNAIYRIPTSPIPQFILDARHPWIEENERWLRRRVDAAQLLCTLNSTMRPDPIVSGTGSRTYPADLFRRLEIDNNRAGTSRYGWANAVARLHEMLDCPAALLDITELSVDIAVHHGLSFESTEEPFDPPAGLPGLLADALLAMPNLRILRWGMPAPQTRRFGRLFEERGLALPGVRDLSVGESSGYMLGVCPRTESLQALDWLAWGYHPDVDPHLLLVRAAASLTNLTGLGMSGGFRQWNAGVLKEVLAATPNLIWLDVRGRLGRHYGGHEAGELLREFVEILAQFPRLADLSLPYSADLEVGFDGGPWCGNAYFGPEGRDLERQVAKEGATATERAAEIVLRSLTNLTTLRIGGISVNLTRDANGGPVTWPWTGRMDEWAWEEIPYTD